MIYLKLGQLGNPKNQKLFKMIRGHKRLTQFQNQLDAVERPIPRDRMGSGKISPMTTQAAGPQVEAKKKMLMQMKAIMALTAA